MEVYSTEKFYIFVKKEKSLWWNRKTGESEIKNGKQKKYFFVFRNFSSIFLGANFFSDLHFLRIQENSADLFAFRDFQ